LRLLVGLGGCCPGFVLWCFDADACSVLSRSLSLAVWCVCDPYLLPCTGNWLDLRPAMDGSPANLTSPTSWRVDQIGRKEHLIDKIFYLDTVSRILHTIVYISSLFFTGLTSEICLKGKGQTHTKARSYFLASLLLPRTSSCHAPGSCWDRFLTGWRAIEMP
jgi:hypothetical protein